MPLNRTFLFLTGLLVCPLFSQEEPPAPDVTPTPTPPPVARVEFSVFVWPTEGILTEESVIPGIPRVFYQSPRGNRPIRLARNTATPLLPYTGTLPLVLYDISEVWTDPPADAPPGTPQTRERIRKPVVRADFPVTWRRAMILVFPGKKNPDGTLVSMALPYDLEKLKPGMARIYNSSDRPLVIQFQDADNRSLALEPFNVIDFTPANLTDKLFSRIFVYGRGGRNGDMQMVHTSKLFFEEDTTNYFFLYPQGKRRVRLLRLGGHADSANATVPDPGDLPKAPSE